MKFFTRFFPRQWTYRCMYLKLFNTPHQPFYPTISSNFLLTTLKPSSPLVIYCFVVTSLCLSYIFSGGNINSSYDCRKIQIQLYYYITINLYLSRQYLENTQNVYIWLCLLANKNDAAIVQIRIGWYIVHKLLAKWNIIMKNIFHCLRATESPWGEFSF